jgi:hypothetical protein
MRFIRSMTPSALAISMLLSAACASGDPDGDDDPDLGSVDSYGSTADLRGGAFNMDGSPDPGVAACATPLDFFLSPTGAPDICATSDAAGAFVLTLPARRNFEIALTKAGQVPRVTLFQTGSRATELFTTMIDEAVVPILYMLAGDTFDPNKGFVTANAYHRTIEDGAEPAPGPENAQLLAGFSFDLVDSGAAAVYLNDQGLPDPSLTATSAGGLVAIFGNVEPGDYDGVISGQPDGEDCAREHQPRGTVRGTVRVRALASTAGGFWFRCRPDADDAQ